MNGDDEIACRRYRVTGRVQGVFFRASAAREAARLGVRGHAANLPDGSVEVLAIGTPAALDELHRWLRRGPPAARVGCVDVRPEAPDEHLSLHGFVTR